MDLGNFLLVPLFGGVTAMVAGAVLYFFPPKRTNSWYGYRTPRSFASQAAWDFAQRSGARGLLTSGLLLTICSPLKMVLDLSENNAAFVGMILLTVLFAIPFIWTERQLKMRFGKHATDNR